MFKGDFSVKEVNVSINSFHSSLDYDILLLIVGLVILFLISLLSKRLHIYL